MENSNTYTEVTETSSGRVGGAGGVVSGFCGSILWSIFGIVLFWSMLFMLGWNEMSTVCVSKAYMAAEQQYQTAGCDSTPGSYSGSLVHFSCPLNAESLPKWSNENFGVSGDELFSIEAVKVAQHVEMYQCVEDVHTKTVKQGERTFESKSYTYHKEWRSTQVDSATFKAWQVETARHALDNGCGSNFNGNPSFPIESKTLQAATLAAGQYDLTRFMGRISSSVPIKLKGGASVTLPGTNARVSVDATQMVSGCQPGRPELGCIKVKYERSGSTEVSYLGRMQDDGTTRAWSAPSSWMCSSKGRSSRVDLFAQGSRDAGHLLESAESDNTLWTWVIRVLGFILAYVGIRSFFAPVEALVGAIDSGLDWFSFIPIVGRLLDFLGNVLRGAVGCAISLIAFGLSVPSCVMVVSIMWAIMRPLIAVPLLVLSCVGLYFTIMAMQSYAKEGQQKKQQ
jgi:hypothetical protein